ncbi:MAG TPA: IclR family transcriptional regulator [Ktedonobacteraceae bacterium]|nr:IclR family transcriptional regulator [Ktedonobacteraceae bacterium]
MVTKQLQNEHIKTYPADQKGDLLQTVQRTFSVLQLIAEHPQGLSTREISTILRFNISTCYHILNTLQACGYADRHPHSQEYSLGPQIPYLNNAFVQGLAKQHGIAEPADDFLTPLYISVTYLSRIRPILFRLTEQTQEPSYMASWSYGEIVLQAIVEAPQAEKITNLYVGYRGQAHSHALGKVLLAYSEPTFIAKYLEQHPLTPFGPNTIVHRSRFMDELNDIVRQGYSVDREELFPDIYCIAAPVFAPQGQIVAALAISFAPNLLSKRAEWLIGQVIRAANHARAELRLAVT